MIDLLGYTLTVLANAPTILLTDWITLCSRMLGIE